MYHFPFELILPGYQSHSQLCKKCIIEWAVIYVWVCSFEINCLFTVWDLIASFLKLSWALLSSYEFSWIPLNCPAFPWLPLSYPELSWVILSSPEFPWVDFPWIKFPWVPLHLPEFPCFCLSSPKFPWVLLTGSPGFPLVPQSSLEFQNFLSEFSWVSNPSAISSIGLLPLVQIVQHFNRS